jgi:hypothetical protein
MKAVNEGVIYDDVEYKEHFEDLFTVSELEMLIKIYTKSRGRKADAIASWVDEVITGFYPQFEKWSSSEQSYEKLFREGELFVGSKFDPEFEKIISGPELYTTISYLSYASDKMKESKRVEFENRLSKTEDWSETIKTFRKESFISDEKSEIPNDKDLQKIISSTVTLPANVAYYRMESFKIIFFLYNKKDYNKEKEEDKSVVLDGLGYSEIPVPKPEPNFWI